VREVHSKAAHYARFACCILNNQSRDGCARLLTLEMADHLRPDDFRGRSCCKRFKGRFWEVLGLRGKANAAADSAYNEAEGYPTDEV